MGLPYEGMGLAVAVGGAVHPLRKPQMLTSFLAPRPRFNPNVRAARNDAGICGFCKGCTVPPSATANPTPSYGQSTPATPPKS